MHNPKREPQHKLGEKKKTVSAAYFPFCISVCYLCSDSRDDGTAEATLKERGEKKNAAFFFLYFWECLYFY